MSLSHLRTFVEVYRCRSISEASRTLGLTQPAVSQHIASLEGQLGRALFDRHARGVSPTLNADDLAASLGQSLDQAEAALAAARARSAQLTGTIHIAAHADYMAEKVAGALAPLLQAGLDLRLHTGTEADLYAMLLEDSADMALTASEPDDRRLAHAEIGHEDLHAVAAPAEARRIAAAEDIGAAIAATPYLAYDLDRPLIAAWFRENRLAMPARVPSVTAPDLRILRSLLCQGAGWSVLPEFLCEPQVRSGDLAIIEPPSVTPTLKLSLVWSRSALRQPRTAFAQKLLLEALKGND